MLTLSSAIEIEFKKEIERILDSLKAELIHPSGTNELADYKFKIGKINGFIASLEVIEEVSARLQRN